MWYIWCWVLSYRVSKADQLLFEVTWYLREKYSEQRIVGSDETIQYLKLINTKKGYKVVFRRWVGSQIDSLNEACRISVNEQGQDGSCKGMEAPMGTGKSSYRFGAKRKKGLCFFWTWKKLNFIGVSSGCSNNHVGFTTSSKSFSSFSMGKNETRIQVSAHFTHEDVHLHGMVSMTTTSKSKGKKDSIPQKFLRSPILICYHILATLTRFSHQWHLNYSFT